MPTDRKPTATGIAGPVAGASDGRPLATRSRVTNGKKWLPGVDMRSERARRWKDVCFALAADLGGNPTTSELALIRQAASLIVRSETMQAQIIAGAEVDDEENVRNCNSVQRIIEGLGLARKRDEREAREQLEAFRAARRTRT